MLHFDQQENSPFNNIAEEEVIEEEAIPDVPIQNVPHVDPQNIAPIKGCTRVTKRPSWYNDFVMHCSQKSISKFIKQKGFELTSFSTHLSIY